MRIGYVRVSTKEQNTARQEELMKSLGVDKVYMDMKKQFRFKQGFENGGSGNITLIIRLSVLTENMENKDVFRLIFALDKEYQQIVKEKCGGNGRKEFKECRLQFE